MGNTAIRWHGKASSPGEWCKLIYVELIRPQDKEGEQHQPFRAHRKQLNWSQDASCPQSQPKRKKSDWPRSMPTLLRKNLDVFRVNRRAHPSCDHAGVKPGGSVSHSWKDGKMGERGGREEICLQ